MHDNKCDACRATGAPLHELQPAEPERPPGPLRLCTSCLDAKTAHVWRGKAGQDLQRALVDKSPEAATHYAYVVEHGNEVRLVRIDREWLEDKLG